MPAFFFGIVFSGQLVIVLITIQFYQGSHAFLYRSLQPEAEWESSMSQYARVYMCVCASVHVCTHTHSYHGKLPRFLSLEVILQYGGNADKP